MKIAETEELEAGSPLPEPSRPAQPRPGRSLTDADYERLAEFRYLLRRFLAFSEAAAGETGLTHQQHQALLMIRGFSGPQDMTVGALAERLGIRHHSAVGLVSRLHSRHLIRRHSNSADRRQVLISLTPEAEALLDGLTLAHRDELTRLAPLLSNLLRQFSG